MAFINKDNIVFSFLTSLIFISSVIESIEMQKKNPGQSIVALHTLIKNYSLATRSQQTGYEKEYINTALLTAKVLYEQAHHAILEVLQEIDSRINYWQYQKDHGLAYFFSKNPLKWVTGEKQEVEIEHKLETLKSHQGELFVLLGQLSKLENEFNLGFKDSFLKDPALGYEWIDTLLNSLTRIKTDTIVVEETTNPFIKRLSQLKLKLQKVSNFKEMILADMPETIIPSRLEQNWLKYGILSLTMRSLYNNFDIQQIQESFDAVTQSFYSILTPVKETLQDIFGIEKTEQNIDTLSDMYKNTVELSKKFAREKGAYYGMPEEELTTIIEGLDKSDYKPLENFIYLIGAGKVPSKWKLTPTQIAQFKGGPDYLLGQTLSGKLLVLNQAVAKQKQAAALIKLLPLIPAMFTGLAFYKGYKKLTRSDYSSLRAILVKINSLFIDSTQPLTDEQYGQMMYLIYKTKQLAKTQLSRQRSLLEEFIADLERIESREYNIVAKRNIIEDMFKKYDFLGFIQQKSA